MFICLLSVLLISSLNGVHSSQTSPSGENGAATLDFSDASKFFALYRTTSKKNLNVEPKSSAPTSDQNVVPPVTQMYGPKNVDAKQPVEQNPPFYRPKGVGPIMMVRPTLPFTESSADTPYTGSRDSPTVEHGYFTPPYTSMLEHQPVPPGKSSSGGPNVPVLALPPRTLFFGQSTARAAEEKPVGIGNTAVTVASPRGLANAPRATRGPFSGETSFGGETSREGKTPRLEGGFDSRIDPDTSKFYDEAIPSTEKTVVTILTKEDGDTEKNEGHNSLSQSEQAKLALKARKKALKNKNHLERSSNQAAQPIPKDHQAIPVAQSSKVKDDGIPDVGESSADREEPNTYAYRIRRDEMPDQTVSSAQGKVRDDKKSNAQTLTSQEMSIGKNGPPTRDPSSAKDAWGYNTPPHSGMSAMGYPLWMEDDSARGAGGGYENQDAGPSKQAPKSKLWELIEEQKRAQSGTKGATAGEKKVAPIDGPVKKERPNIPLLALPTSAVDPVQTEDDKTNRVPDSSFQMKQASVVPQVVNYPTDIDEDGENEAPPTTRVVLTDDKKKRIAAIRARQKGNGAAPSERTDGKASPRGTRTITSFTRPASPPETPEVVVIRLENTPRDKVAERSKLKQSDDPLLVKPDSGHTPYDQLDKNSDPKKGKSVADDQHDQDPQSPKTSLANAQQQPVDAALSTNSNINKPSSIPSKPALPPLQDNKLFLLPQGTVLRETKMKKPKKKKPEPADNQDMIIKSTDSVSTDKQQELQTEPLVEGASDSSKVFNLFAPKFANALSERTATFDVPNLASSGVGETTRPADPKHSAVDRRPEPPPSPSLPTQTGRQKPQSSKGSDGGSQQQPHTSGKVGKTQSPQQVPVQPQNQNPIVSGSSPNPHHSTNSHTPPRSPGFTENRNHHEDPAELTEVIHRMMKMAENVNDYAMRISEIGVTAAHAATLVQVLASLGDLASRCLDQMDGMDGEDSAIEKMIDMTLARMQDYLEIDDIDEES